MTLSPVNFDPQLSPVRPRCVVGYGSRPVSVDLARGHCLTGEPAPQPGVAVTPSAARHDRNAVDHLSLKHWPRGHRVVVGALAGGTGRTTVAGALANLLAELPFAHIWPPVLLFEPAPRRLSTTLQRWGVNQETTLSQAAPPGDNVPSIDVRQALSGVNVLVNDRTAGPNPAGSSDELLRAVQHHHSVVVLDAPVGLPSDLSWVREAPNTVSILLIVRPDQTSLAEAAEALVWMNDHHVLPRHQVTVVINHAHEAAVRNIHPAKTALESRCAAVHELPHHRVFDPGYQLPTGEDMPKRLRLRLAQIGLDVWSSSQLPPLKTPITATSNEAEEE